MKFALSFRNILDENYDFLPRFDSDILFLVTHLTINIDNLKGYKIQTGKSMIKNIFIIKLPYI